MSSPITAGLTVDPLTALLAAAAIHAVQEIAGGIAAAQTIRHEHAAHRSTREDSLRAADAEGRSQLEAKARQAETQLRELLEIAGRLGLGAGLQSILPEPPAYTDQDSLARYVTSLETLTQEARSILLTEAGHKLQEDSAIHALAEFLAPPSPTDLPPSARLLIRLAHLDSIPTEIAQLAQEYDHCTAAERAELLATELRLRIGAHLKAEQQRQLDAATATIIEQSLKDLGYQVEPVANTFYVEGGVIHIRRPGWGEHMVRLRLDFRQKTANFNVIRAVREGDNERSVADHLAEDRWCTEFPALMQALAARGVHLNVTRRVEPGDLPVQLVNRDRLPVFADEEEADQTKAPLARKLP